MTKLAALFCALPALAWAAPTLQGCPVQPADNVWNAKVDMLPVHANSAAYINSIGATRGFHMDFGSGLFNGEPIGIPFVVVSGSQAKVPVVFDYADESDPGPYPIPPTAPIEGGAASSGDRHVLVIDKDNCILYETFYSFPVNNGTSWTAGSGAKYDLRSNALRPSGWTSADAAGLPVFPGLVRYDEAAAGVIEHAIRFTASITQRAFIWPARHFASSNTSTSVPPMGLRVRLKASYDINRFTGHARVIAQAMKTYGMILADNGSNWFVSGAPDDRWSNDLLHTLDVLRGSDFEAVDESSLMADANSGRALGTTSALTVAKAGTGSGVLTSSPAGIDCGATCMASFTIGSAVTLTAAATAGSTFAGWSGSTCTGTGSCTVTMTTALSVAAAFNTTGTTSPLGASPTSLAFGGQSMNTTSPAQTVTISNTGTTSLTISSLAASTHFGITHTCGSSLAAGATCTASVTLTPGVEGSLSGFLTITSGSVSQVVALTGTGEKSLVTHYYRSILRRAPDSGGKAFWDAEAVRVQALGANVNEVWFALAQNFYFSTEYIAQNRDNTGFVTDLYTTFFNRAPDSGGRDYWVGQIVSGLPREVVLLGFMFSPEFSAFTQAIFGSTSVRREVDTVGDFYRGLLARLPDDGGFNYWVGQFRTAQCSGGNAVIAQVEAISSAYANSSEYVGRNRSNTQYVSDLYNSFLRRAGDLQGVQFWISQIATGARTRENVRQQFIQTPEFQTRVQAIIAAGCKT